METLALKTFTARSQQHCRDDGSECFHESVWKPLQEWCKCSDANLPVL